MQELVTVITPTTPDREGYNNLCRQYIANQDYQGEIEHIFDYSNKTIGEKRNSLCEQAKGEIIIHADSDDWYGPDWVRLSVEHLLRSKRQITGMSSTYFYLPHHRLYKYQYRGSQYYAIGGTMCYLKSAWETGKFQNISNGEDLYFLHGKTILPHNNIDSFCAIIHNTNVTGRQKYSGAIYTPLNIQHMKLMLDKDYYNYPMP